MSSFCNTSIITSIEVHFKEMVLNGILFIWILANSNLIFFLNLEISFLILYLVNFFLTEVNKYVLFSISIICFKESIDLILLFIFNIFKLFNFNKSFLTIGKGIIVFWENLNILFWFLIMVFMCSSSSTWSFIFLNFILWDSFGIIIYWSI